MRPQKFCSLFEGSIQQRILFVFFLCSNMQCNLSHTIKGKRMQDDVSKGQQAVELFRGHSLNNMQSIECYEESGTQRR